MDLGVFLPSSSPSQNGGIGGGGDVGESEQARRAGFVVLVILAKMGDKHTTEEIHDMACQQLHSGPWHAMD